MSSRIRQALEHDKYIYQINVINIWVIYLIVIFTKPPLIENVYLRSSDSDDADGIMNPSFLGDSGILRGYDITTSTPR